MTTKGRRGDQRPRRGDVPALALPSSGSGGRWRSIHPLSPVRRAPASSAAILVRAGPSSKKIRSCPWGSVAPTKNGAPRERKPVAVGFVGIVGPEKALTRLARRLPLSGVLIRSNGHVETCVLESSDGGGRGTGSPRRDPRPGDSWLALFLPGSPHRVILSPPAPPFPGGVFFGSIRR